MKKDERQRVWAMIVYRESAPAGWMELLRALHVPMAISPEHDADDGEIKPHWHVLLTYDGKKSRAQVEEVVRLVHGAGPIGVHSVSGYARYLCHLDDAGKTAYNPADVVCLSGFDYVQYLQPSGTQLRELVREIDSFIITHDITEVYELVDYAMECEPEWYAVLQSPSQLGRVSRLIASARYSTMPCATRRKL